MTGKWWWVVELLVALVALVALYFLRQRVTSIEGDKAAVVLRFEYRGQICFCIAGLVVIWLCLPIAYAMGWAPLNDWRPLVLCLGLGILVPPAVVYLQLLSRPDRSFREFLQAYALNDRTPLWPMRGWRTAGAVLIAAGVCGVVFGKGY